jgi:hypothetical protein
VFGGFLAEARCEGFGVVEVLELGGSFVVGVRVRSCCLSVGLEMIECVRAFALLIHAAPSCEGSICVSS